MMDDVAPQTDQTTDALPAEVAGWIGQVVVREDGPIQVDIGAMENFAVAVEDANPLYWDEEAAEPLTGGRIAPPAMLSAWTRPHTWSPNQDTPALRPLELHFRLKESLNLPRAVVVDSETEFHAPARPGDRVRSEQVLDEVGPVYENKLGCGRKWTISIHYRREDGVLLGIDRLKFFAYGGDA